jgi:integrase
MTAAKRKQVQARAPAELPQLPVARAMQQPLPLWMQGPPTVERVVALYLEEYLKLMGRAKGTYESYAGPLRWFATVLPPFPTPGHVKQALQKRLDAGELMPQTCNQYKKYLKAAFTYARNFWANVAVRDPTTFPNWKVPRRPPRALVNPGFTFPRLLAEACQNDTERALLCVLALLGGRISEARGLRWDGDLSPGFQKLTFQRQRVARRKEETDLKSEASHAHVDVPEVLRGYLRGAWQERLAVLARGGTSWQTRDARAPYLFNYGQERLAKLMARCRAVSPESFPEKTAERGALAFHAFRDTLGALLAAQDTPLRDGQEALRHASPMTTSGYFQNHRGRPMGNAALQGAQALLAGGLLAGAPRGGLHVVE